MQKRDILLIDSGVGGLTVADEVCKMRPDKSVAYFADFAQFPYGNKGEAWLIERLKKLIDLCQASIQAEIIVIACNTASTTVLPAVRAHTSVPIVGVVPAIKPAALASKKKCIGLLATPGTVKRTYIDDLISSYAADCEVIRVGTKELVEMAERKLRGQEFHPEDLRRVCNSFFDSQGNLRTDHVVLGCTHFPHLIDDLKKYVSDEIVWLDSGEAIASRVSELLGPPKDAVSAKPLFLYSGSESLDPALEKYLRDKSFLIDQRA